MKLCHLTFSFFVNYIFFSLKKMAEEYISLFLLSSFLISVLWLRLCNSLSRLFSQRLALCRLCYLKLLHSLAQCHSLVPAANEKPLLIANREIRAK